MRIDFFGNIDRLRLPFDQITGHTKATNNGSTISATPKINGEFLKGPIPLVWLSAAAGLPGKASLAVGLAIWFESGRRKSHDIVLTTAILERFSVNRKAKYRGLKALEAVGLISVVRRPKKNPIVTIKTEPDQSSGTTADNGGTDVSTNNTNHK